MKKLQKILKITGISLVALLALAIILPIVFKAQIVARIKTEINHNINAVVDFKDVDLSLLRRFPRLSIRLENVSVVGKDEFSKDTLLSSRSVDAAMNLFSLFKEEKNIYSIDLASPRIHALINKEGKANWDIAKAGSGSSVTDTSASAFKMKLNHYSIRDAYVLYKDETADMTAEV